MKSGHETDLYIGVYIGVQRGFKEDYRNLQSIFPHHAIIF